MKTIYNWIFTAVFALITTAAFSQGTISGSVVDGSMGQPLPGANVMIKGSNIGTSTDFDGNFTLDVNQDSGTVTVSYIGFIAKQVSYTLTNGTANIGTVSLKPDAQELEGVVVVGSGIIDLARDRQTPIAVSTVGVEEIQAKAVGNVEFPEILKNTPSVYVSNQSGGFGESQMFVRGFDQTNTAFLLNGQPINGMEDGKVYWSNWSGMSDIAQGIQIQRGLGSSKLAISSVGGTVNIVTKTTEMTKGGFARFMVGNGSYFKTTAAYNTGMSENGWGFSFLLDHWQAHSKYADGTKGQGQNYFFSVGKKAGDHNFNFLFTGAPQWHDQNFSKSQELFDRYGLKYNNNYGFYRNQSGDYKYLSLRRNYYHKPVINLNWDWAISEKSNLSTVVYASFGRGGGTGDYGNGVSYVDNGDDSMRGAYLPSNGQIDWDYIRNSYNAGIANGISEGYNGTMLRSSVNNHAWYGAVVNYEFDTQNEFKYNVGADVRFYKGDHFRQITDLLGLKGRIEPIGGRPDGYIVDETFDPNPWAALFNYADKDQRIDYDYSENINYQGVFGQAEYAKDNFSAFVQGALSNQSYKREDRGNFDFDNPKKSEKVSRTGYNLKGGAAWEFSEGHTIYANAGNYSRQPFLDNIFPSYDDNTQLAEPKVDNEKILGLEAGYRLQLGNFIGSFNAYYTSWDNRFQSFSGEYEDVADAIIRLTNIGQLHKGIEIDGKWRPTNTFMLRGYFTVGNWEYDGSSPVYIIDNNDNSAVDNFEVDLTGTKVGQAPQTSFGLGTSFDVIQDKFSVDADWNYYANLYGFVDAEDVAQNQLDNAGVYQPEKLDAYSLFDLGATYRLQFGSDDISIRGNVYNLFDTEYINQKDSYGYYYGNGLTWNLSVRYNF
jgi:outer membrane receptor protein involved in Fe transport